MHRFHNYLSEGWKDTDVFILVQFILVASDNIRGFRTKYLELVDCHRPLINDGTFLPVVRGRIKIADNDFLNTTEDNLRSEQTPDHLQWFRNIDVELFPLAVMATSFISNSSSIFE